MLNLEEEEKKTKAERHWYAGSRFNRFVFWFKNLSFIKHILFFYLLITVIGAVLLYLPISQQKNNVHFIDSLFTSASAFSDTGLVTKTTGEAWTIFGQTVIAILILIGGIGFFALKIFFFNILFGKPISLAGRNSLSGERGSSTVGNASEIVKISVIAMFGIIFVSSIVLSIWFYFSHGNFDNTLWSQNHELIHIKDNASFDPSGNWGTSIRYGIFHSISALNNAGFDIMGHNSLAPYYSIYFIQIWFILLFVTGGIGYPVIYDIYAFSRNKMKGKVFHFSLFTKISMTAYLLIALFGLGITFSIELSARPTVTHTTFWEKIHNKEYGSVGDGVMAIIFNTMSTRNAGFATINVYDWTQGTQLVHSILMIIGSAPSSTAGGIRTTTLALIVMGVWSRIRGKTSARAFNRRIPTETLNRAYIVFTTAITLVIIATLISMTSFDIYGGKVLTEVDGVAANTTQMLSVSKNEPHTFVNLFFEVSSAFGTTGLSTGITPLLSTVSKITLIFVMFIGQLGVSSTILIWSKKGSKSRHYKYIKEDITIG